MQDQTVPQNFLVTFDPLAGVDPVKAPVTSTTSQIADRVQEAFEAIDITVGAININLTAGTVAVEDTDGDVIERARIEGPGVGEKPTPTPGPSYFKAVDDLQRAIRSLMDANVADPYGYVAMVAAESGGLAAEQRKLAAVGAKSEPAEPDDWLTLAADLAEAADRLTSLAGTTPPLRVTLHILGAAPGNTDRAVAALVDTVAGVFDATPRSSSFPDGTSVYQADRNVGAFRFQVSAYLPAEQSELERLRARNAELEARLAAGGAL